MKTPCSCHCHSDVKCNCVESNKMSNKDRLTHAVYFALHAIQIILILKLV